MVACFEDALGLKMSDADAICVAAAGVYDGTALINANAYPFPMNFGQLAQEQSWAPLAVVHDYTPIVCRSFIPPGQCYSEGIVTINQGDVDPHGRHVALGMGTGLGLKDGVMLPDGQLWLGHNEVGHAGLAMPPEASEQDVARHLAWVDFLRTHYPHKPLSFETTLSGRGLAWLHQFVAGLAEPVTPRQVQVEVSQDTTEGLETLSLYAWYLGLFVSTVQLMFMPAGGIWIAGGLVERIPQLFAEPFVHSLRRGIDSASAYAEFRQRMPIFGIVEPPHVLLGAAYYAHHIMDA